MITVLGSWASQEVTAWLIFCFVLFFIPAHFLGNQEIWEVIKGDEPWWGHISWRLWGGVREKSLRVWRFMLQPRPVAVFLWGWPYHLCFALETFGWNIASNFGILRFSAFSLSLRPLLQVVREGINSVVCSLSHTFLFLPFILSFKDLAQIETSKDKLILFSVIHFSCYTSLKFWKRKKIKSTYTLDSLPPSLWLCLQFWVVAN